MVNLEELRGRGLRAYETSRLRMVARVLVYVAPVVVLCWWFADEREACACLGAVLLAVAVWMRWRSRNGVEAVTTGLLAGGVPLATGLYVAEVLPACEGLVCLGTSAAAGCAAGLWVAIRQRRRQSPVGSWFAAGTITILAASLGCISLGVLGIAGVAAGVIVGGGLGILTSSPG